MRKLFCFVIATIFLLICLPGKSYCYAAASQLELEWDHLTPIGKDRDLDTESLHILKKVSETPNKSIYRGITITRPRGDILWEKQNRNSSAAGAGPVYLLRYERQAGKLSTALDISGGFIVYDKKFPAGGQYYNFMWRLGPRFIYKINENSSVNIGYTFMHVSNGLRTHNPGYDAHGVSLGFSATF